MGHRDIVDWVLDSEVQALVASRPERRQFESDESYEAANRSYTHRLQQVAKALRIGLSDITPGTKVTGGGRF